MGVHTKTSLFMVGLIMTAKCILRGRLEYLTEQLINLKASKQVMSVIFQDADLFAEEQLELETNIKLTQIELGELE